MRIALAQLNPTVGDIAGNTAAIARCLDEAWRAGADLLVCPELAVIGYPPKDLLLKPAAIRRCREAVESLAARCTTTAAIIGYPARADDPAHGRPLYNAAAFCADGKIVQTHVKSLLPTYDVFDEQRYFEPASLADHPTAGPDADAHDLARVNGVAVGVTICEDLWNEPAVFARTLYRANPVERLAGLGARLIVNASASPYVLGKHAFRTRLFRETARRFNLPVVFCNQVGGNDELIFDGASFAMDAKGDIIAQARDFGEELLIVDLPVDQATDIPRDEHSESSRITLGDAASSADDGEGESGLPVTINHKACVREGMASVYHALVMGLADYCRKCGFSSTVVGLSGGIDSAVTAALCVGALGPEKVRGVAMPSRYSSPGSIDDARELAASLGIQFDVLPIDDAHRAFEGMLSEVFAGREPDVAEENIQARSRGVILMAISNKFGSLLVTTGNKSELAVGYCTLYGDMAGGLAVLSDVPKTMVWDLARWINDDARSPLRERFGGPVIPESSITKPPSAELRPDQKDEDSLPPYPVLDQIIERYVEQEQSADQIFDAMDVDRDELLRVVKLIDRSEYKRKQAAPGLKVTARAFGFGRRMPIAQRYDNGAAAADAGASAART